jgi:microcystin degradation protein MlrC
MAKPRIAVAGFQHETNTFSPIPTPLAVFERGGSWPGLTRGAAVPEVFAGSNIPVAGFLEAAAGFETIPILWAAAEPSSYVEEAAFEAIAGEIVEGCVAARPDGVYLDLHGAMVTRAHDDPEAELLRRLRAALGEDLPIVVSLDLHANISEAFARRASATAVYRTYPHVDMAQTGARAAGLMARLLADGPLAAAWRQPDYIPPITDQSTMREPGRRLYARLPEIEAETGAVAVEFAFGFPPADIPHCGPAILAYAETQSSADAAADAMLAELAMAESEFADPLTPAAAAVAEAMRLAEGAAKPVVIADPQDNPGAGGVGDSTGLLAALIAAKAPGAALAGFWSPAAAAAAHAAGEGATLALSLGGADPESGGPALAVTATVERLSDGVFAYTGPMYGGATAHLGPMALLRLADGAGDLRVVVVSERAQNADQATFRAIGVEPTAQRILAVKSAVHFLADYEPIAERVLFAAAPGANPCDLPRLPYRRLRRGVRLGPNGPVFSGG